MSTSSGDSEGGVPRGPEGSGGSESAENPAGTGDSAGAAGRDVPGGEEQISSEAAWKRASESDKEAGLRSAGGVGDERVEAQEESMPPEELSARMGRAQESQHKPRTPAEERYARQNAEAAAAGEVGFGAHRYAADPADVPPPGSEESWSAEPSPGFRTDPVLRKAYSTRRIAVTAVAGVCVLAFAFWFGAKGLASKSPNGNGSAPWTSAPKVDGAVVGGINAQDNIGEAAYNNGTAAAIVREASVECADPINDPAALAAGTGQAIALTGWDSVAGPTLNALQQGSQNLNTAIVSQDAPKIAAATKAMCASMIAARNLPPINDPTAATAWKSALESWAGSVKDSLQATTGSMFEFNSATAELANAQTAFDALQSRLANPS